jgi:hypothetical protein
MFEVIEWGMDSLFKLITKRIAFSVPETFNSTDILKWNYIFIDDAQGKPSYEYIIDRTLNRPRELIQFCIDSRDRAVEIRSDKIDMNAIVSSEVKYSDKRTKDIAMEYKFQFPNLINIFELFRGKQSLITRVFLEELFTKVLMGEIGIKDCGWLNNQSEEYIINILWQVGFLKIYTTCYINGHLTEGYYGIHQTNQSNISGITKFMIHPMFRMYLGIVDTEISSQISA